MHSDLTLEKDYVIIAAQRDFAKLSHILTIPKYSK